MTVPFVIEDIDPIVEGGKVPYDITWIGVTSLASPSATVYKDGQDITSTVMTTGADSVSGNVQTLKLIEALSNHGGSKYVVNFTAVLDSGETGVGKFTIPILRPGDEG
jgi:hypothetical protein